MFQPCGTNFAKGDNFVLNNHALFGYFKNYRNYTFQVEFIRPDSLYPSTSLNLLKTGFKYDVFKAKNYSELIDCPILYCIPDTASYYEGNTKITISVYSDSKCITSKMLVNEIKQITRATSLMFDSLPCTDYKFIFYFFNEKNVKQKNLSYGALEHKNSSFYYILSGTGKSIDSLALFKDIREMSSHELLHIFVPWRLRSKELANMDYYEPKMSKHLWLYEGVTEYLSLKALLKAGLIDIQQFLEMIKVKIFSAEYYKDLPLTLTSKKILSKKHQKQFSNFYEKGALVAFLLDIELSKQANEHSGLLGLIKKLLDKYKNMPFADNSLIDEIMTIGDSKVDAIFDKYITGKDKIEFKSYFESIGINYLPSTTKDIYSFGEFKSIHYRNISEPQKSYFVLKPLGKTKLGKQKFVIHKINGKKVSFERLTKFLFSPKSTDEVEFEIKRNNKNEILKQKPDIVNRKVKHFIEIKKEMTNEQKANYKKVFLIE